jgi:hypothetical protein
MPPHRKCCGGIKNKLNGDGQLNTPEKIMQNRYSSDMSICTLEETPLSSNEALLRPSDSFVQPILNTRQLESSGTLSSRVEMYTSPNKSYYAPKVTIRQYYDLKQNNASYGTPYISSNNMPTANHMPNFNIQADMASPYSNTTRNIEPDRFDGSSTEWTDYIIHFEQVAAWNK